MSAISLRAKCADCVALCCVSLAFDRSVFFAIYKPAGSACPNLAGHRCRIHEDLAGQGFAGCARYDCLGAGQRTTRLFGGRSWRSDASLRRPMFEAYLQMRELHECLELLHLCAALALTQAKRAQLGELRQRLEHAGESLEALRTCHRADLRGEVRDFLRSVEAAVGDQRRAGRR